MTTPTAPATLSSSQQLKGKCALVTGSTSGIGLGIACALAAHGANIMLNGFGDHAAAERLIAGFGVEVDYHGADMSKPDEVSLQKINPNEIISSNYNIFNNNHSLWERAFWCGRTSSGCQVTGLLVF